jgi:3-oxosteroid 1-dehydrogenase
MRVAQQRRWDVEVDVISLGSGLGGLTAAIVAHDRGARALVLEKAEKLGGICGLSVGVVFVPGNHKLAEEGRHDPPEDALRYFRFLSGGLAEADLQRQLLASGREAARYLEEKAGLTWQIVANLPDYQYPHAPGAVDHGRYLEPALFPGTLLGDWQDRTYKASPHQTPSVTWGEVLSWGGHARVRSWDFRTIATRRAKDIRGGGAAMMGYLVKAALIDRKIPAYTSTPARELLVEGGAVVGVRAERDGRDFFVRARKAVVLAVGGYDWRPDFTKYYEGLPELRSMCPPHIEGDNLVLGGEIGAAVAGVPGHNFGLYFGYNIPGEEYEGKPLWRASGESGLPHTIWVNRAGKRFCDESFYREFLPRCRLWSLAEQRHVNLPPFLIFDQNFRDKYAFGTFMPGLELPEELVARAATPRALAAKLGVDPDGLEDTLARFNDYASGGMDPDFGRGRYRWAAVTEGDDSMPNPNLGPLDKAPYYGVALKPIMAGAGAVGLKTNVHAQVMHLRGHAIEGLYAVGNAAAALDTNGGAQSGIWNLRGLAWGYVAGVHASGR